MTSRRSSLVGRIALVAGLLAGPGIVVAAAPAQAAYLPTAAATAAYEARVIAQINVQRVKYARGKLAAGWCPDWYAGHWAAYLARTGAFYHRDMTTILVGCKATRAAENLARGYTADGTVVAWMASPGHRANVLDGSLTRIGVAAVYANGQWTVAANFTRG